jgi:hypothetical protein
MKNLYNKEDVAQFEQRIHSLTPQTKPIWGTMNAAQMLAHCNVAFVMAFENTYSELSAFKRFFLRLLIKDLVVNEKPYRKGSPTAKEFLVPAQQDFEAEKQKLIAYLHKTLELGASYFEGKSSRSFGPLTAKEWNIMFAKHLDHHLNQFGV